MNTVRIGNATVTFMSFSELRMTPEERALYQGFVEKRKYQTAYTKRHPMVGTRIWKLAMQFQSEWRVSDIPLGQPENGLPILFRASQWTLGQNRYVVTPIEGQGLVCQCYEQIPDNWIGFRIVKMHALGRTAIVKPVVGTMTELFERS
jgi:hypothetical protein